MPGKTAKGKTTTGPVSADKTQKTSKTPSPKPGPSTSVQSTEDPFKIPKRPNPFTVSEELGQKGKIKMKLPNRSNIN